MKSKTWLIIGVVVAVILMLTWLFLGTTIVEKEELNESVTEMSNMP